MRKVFVLLLSAIAVALVPRPGAQAQEIFTPAAVVNDEIVSVLDLTMRLRLAMLASGLEPSPEAENELAGPVLRQLIDERLQMQEAERLGITVPQADVDDAIAEIAANNNMTRDQFIGLLEDNQVALRTLEQQVRATLAWNQVVALRLMPEVDISEEQIDETIARIEASGDTAQVRLAEIVLHYDTAQERAEAEELALRLIDELQRGASFQQLARQFSTAPTAAAGGDMGWIPEGDLPDEIGAVVSGLPAGQLAGPVDSFGGIHILALIDRQQIGAAPNPRPQPPPQPQPVRQQPPEPQGPRPTDQTRLRLTQILFEADEAEAEQMAEIAMDAVSEVRGCSAAEQLAQRVGAPGSGDMGELRLRDMPEELQDLLGHMPEGVPSPPIFVGGAIAVIFICSRQGDAPPVAAAPEEPIEPDLPEPVIEPPPAMAGLDREAIGTMLRRERLGMLESRYLRDLRRSANVEIRI